MHQHAAPNHHAHHAGFSGISGVVAALSMTTGRGDDAEFAARLGGVAAGDTVLDIGCGPGAAARHAAKAGATVIGIDPAAVMLRVARLLTRSRRVSYKTGVAEALPVADRSAQIAWSIATVHHWPDLGAALTEVRRVLVSGGRFVAMERRVQPGAQGLASHGWTPEQAATFADLCERHGFVDVRTEEYDGKRRSLVSVVATAP
jgi:ubiquinone/menaquinone biosynthesis C-methylase UbiE